MWSKFRNSKISFIVTSHLRTLFQIFKQRRVESDEGFMLGFFNVMRKIQSIGCPPDSMIRTMRLDKRK